MGDGNSQKRPLGEGGREGGTSAPPILYEISSIIKFRDQIYREPTKKKVLN